jgi:hypothetical protein
MNPKQKTTADLKASIDYELAKKEHEDRIAIRRFELDRMLGLMEFYHPGIQWSVGDIRRFMTHQIDMAEAMDGPSVPSSDYANNH